MRRPWPTGGAVAPKTNKLLLVLFVALIQIKTYELAMVCHLLRDLAVFTAATAADPNPYSHYGFVSRNLFPKSLSRTVLLFGSESNSTSGDEQILNASYG